MADALNFIRILAVAACLALCFAGSQVLPAHAAGSVPGFNLTPQFDLTGRAERGCRLLVVQAVAVATTDNAFPSSSIFAIRKIGLSGGRVPQHVAGVA